MAPIRTPYNNVFQRKADQPIIACCLRLDGKNQSESTFWIVVWGFKARDSLAVAATTPVTSNMLRKYSFLELWSRCHKARSHEPLRKHAYIHALSSLFFNQLVEAPKMSSELLQETFVDPDSNDQQCYTASTYQSGGRVNLEGPNKTIHSPTCLVYN